MEKDNSPSHGPPRRRRRNGRPTLKWKKQVLKNVERREMRNWRVELEDRRE